jgi:hypothetical protein
LIRRLNGEGVVGSEGEEWSEGMGGGSRVGECMRSPGG